MEREAIKPASREEWLQLRTRDVTSTEVAALFGLSPYTTKFELYHRKKDQEIVEIEGNERMLWGNRLETAIANGVAEDFGITVRKMDEYMRVKELRAGASFDFSINDETGLLEIKNVDALQFRENWTEDDDGNIEAPEHIELQVQAQLFVSGRSYAKIACLKGGNKLVVLERELDPLVVERIQEEIYGFWNNHVDKGIAPEPDFQKDADFISQLYKSSTPGKIIDASQSPEVVSLAHAYRSYAEAEKQAYEGKQACKAQILTMIDDAVKVVGDGFSISATTTKESVVQSFVKKPYRNFRINWKKGR